MSTINLAPGEVAVVITPGPDDTYNARAFLNHTELDEANPDAVADAFYFACLARGLADLAVLQEATVYNAGEASFANDIDNDVA